MPVEETEKGYHLTGKAINAYRYMVLKQALKLESKGMKSRGGALRPKLAQEFGLSARAPYEEFIAACEAKVATIKAQESAEAAS